MKKRISIFLVGVFLSVFSWGQSGKLSLASPEEILIKANKGVLELSDVLADLRENIFELRDKTTFIKYFSLLKDLKVLSDKYNLEGLYQGSVDDLGRLMVYHGMHWLTLVDSSIEEILYFHKWADDISANQFIDDEELRTRKTKDVLKLKLSVEKLDKLSEFQLKNFPQATSLHNRYRSLLSEIVMQFVRSDILAQTDLNFWISHLSTSDGYWRYLAMIKEQIFEINKKNKENIHLYILNLGVFKKRLLQDPYYSDEALNTSLAELAQNLIKNSVTLEESLSDSEITQIMSLLNRPQYQSLAESWIQVNYLPSIKYVEFYIKISTYLVGELLKINLLKEAQSVKLFLQKIIGPILAAAQDTEGTYYAKDNEGRGWKVTIARVKMDELIIGIGHEMRDAYQSFFSVIYDYNTNEYIASDYGLDNITAGRPFLKFKVLSKDKISIDYSFFGKGRIMMKGHKIQSYPNYWLKAEQSPLPISGTYKGKAADLNGNLVHVTLTLQSLESITIGLWDFGTAVNGLRGGSPGRDGVIYLTTGDKRDVSWFHLRAYQDLKDRNILHGVYIVGGVGISKEFTFKKVKE